MSINKDILKRILILDGAMGTMIQKYGLTEEDYHTGPFCSCVKELKGNNECLNITRRDIIKAIHKEYIAAGADIIETNTFSANVISQAEYGCEAYACKMAYEGARIAREAADEASELAVQIGLSRKVWVAGSMGPTSKSLSLSPDVSDPAFRPFSYDEMKEAYRQQARALIDGGADLLLLETCFDALNTKAALSGIYECMGNDTVPPVMISVSVGDRSGRTLTGQTLEAFYTSVCHFPILSFGLNCSLGASELRPLVEDISKWCMCGISCYPNAGLPNEMGGYDQSPEEMAEQIKTMAACGLVNIVGGCCGTTPEHIRSIADAVKDIKPRSAPEESVRSLKVSGLETVCLDVKHNNFTNVGERTNVAGSRKFAKLIAAGEYDTALQIAAKQIEDGASIIDINMDDAMLDSTREMERFVRYISNDPATAKAALMIDSSHWDTILAGLKNAQGKCIVNSISLKEGPQSFIEKAKTIKSLGASMVIMAFDENGQATTYDRKIEICKRAYELLTEEAGINPEDIIFDVNILSIGTGIEEHARYAIDFIEAVRWIKKNLPGALTSGGVSNLSFSFRGNNAVREAMHSAFLYHAIKAGLDMAIVNPSMLQVYDDIEPELLKCVEDVIFDKDVHATERLIEKASLMMAQKQIQSSQPETASAEIAVLPVSERLRNSLIKGTSVNLEADLKEAMETEGSAVAIIEGALMEGMETVGKMFGEGKMFLPQVVKSAKVMRDAVEILEPFLSESENQGADDSGTNEKKRPVIVIATVKGDVHDIGKNITGIVLTCNGFDVHDLGVMVDKETIIETARNLKADIIAVSGLITPSLYQMEELCKAMRADGMNTPLFIGGATTSAVHTAVKLAPLYDHVFYGSDASASAVMAKRYMMNPKEFEQEQHEQQNNIRNLYETKDSEEVCKKEVKYESFPYDTYPETAPEDIRTMEVPLSDVIPYFDWKMFYAIWGVKYGSSSPEAMELMQLRREAEEELEMGNMRIMLSARFFMGCSDGRSIKVNEPHRFGAPSVMDYGNSVFRKETSAIQTSDIMKMAASSFSIPFMRQEQGTRRSLCDFVISEESGRKSPFGIFAISVASTSKSQEEGCCCPACSNRFEDMIGKAVRLTLAEAASKWLDRKLEDECKGHKIIKPAIGYSSCPDHSLKSDVLFMLHDNDRLGIRLTESYAMTPEASICGMIFIHQDATYPDIRRISQTQYEDYSSLRNLDEENARRLLGYLLK